MEDRELPGQNRRLVQHELSGETMLHDEAEEEIHVLNAVAAYIFRYCDGVTTERDLVEKMKQDFPEVSEAVLLNDIRSTLDDFRERAIIETA